MAFVRACNVFSVFSRLIISFCMRLDSGVIYLLDFDDMSYGLYKNISLS